jgi:hypothetical protein
VHRPAAPRHEDGASAGPPVILNTVNDPYLTGREDGSFAALQDDSRGRGLAVVKSAVFILGGARTGMMNRVGT